MISVVVSDPLDNRVHASAMKTVPRLRALLISVFFASIPFAAATEWQVLFDGSSLEGWKHAEENQQSIRIEDRMLVLNGDRCHLYWVGEDGQASFKNFELEIVFQTEAKANSGLFFHTRWQARDWPGYGLECQINATHEDERKTGSIFGVRNVAEPGHKDGEWVTMKLRVEGDVAKVWLNGEPHNEWTQTAEHTWKKKRIASGTFALQAHDPGSTVKIKSVRVMTLP